MSRPATKLAALIAAGLLLLAGCENALLEKAKSAKDQRESPVMVVTDSTLSVVANGGSQAFPDTSIIDSAQVPEG